MPFRSYRSAPVVELGQVGVRRHRRDALILAVPTVSLLLPGLAVEVADAGGSGELTRIAAAVATFLVFYSGVFALIALTAAVGAGLVATDRLVMSADARIRAQALHRTMSLTGIAALANHIMLEILASRASVLDGFIPFLSARSTLFMGVGTLSSDLFVVIILTGVLRRRFTGGGRPQLWRWLHTTAYAAWPMAVLHGLLAGRSAQPYVDWSYGACLAAVALALTVRYVMLHRGRSSALGGMAGRSPASALLASSALLSPMPVARARQSVVPQAPPRALPPSGPLRALPDPDPGEESEFIMPRPPRWAGAPWSQPEPAETDSDAWAYDGDAPAPDQEARTAPAAPDWER